MGAIRYHAALAHGKPEGSTVTTLPRLLPPSAMLPEIRDTVNAATDRLRRLPEMEILEFEVRGLALPFVIPTIVVAPVHVTCNARDANDDSATVSLTVFGWRAPDAREIEVHTLTGLTLGASYLMSFFILGVGRGA